MSEPSTCQACGIGTAREDESLCKACLNDMARGITLEEAMEWAEQI